MEGKTRVGEVAKKHVALINAITARNVFKWKGKIWKKYIPGRKQCNKPPTMIICGVFYSSFWLAILSYNYIMCFNYT